MNMGLKSRYPFIFFDHLTTTTGINNKQHQVSSRSNVTLLETNNSSGSMYTEHHSALHLQQSQGDSTSLASLTCRFIELLNRVNPPYGNGELDLNVAMHHLGVQKRRLYDVTNVLEGIGLIKKENKNFISWVDRGMGKLSLETENAEKVQKQQIEAEKIQLQKLDNFIEILSKQVRDYTTSSENPVNKAVNGESSSKLFVTKQDICSLQNYANDTVIAIRAPSGTSLEVPNPDEGMRPGMRRFQIYLTSPSDSTGQVNVVLVQHGGKKETSSKKVSSNKQTRPPQSIKPSQWAVPPSNSRVPSYPLQTQRAHQQQHPPHRSNNCLPPQLPPPDSLPKYISPIKTCKLSHRPILRKLPEPSVSGQSSNELKSKSSKFSQIPMLSRRPSNDFLPCKRKLDSPTVVLKPKIEDKDMDVPDCTQAQKKKKTAGRPLSPTLDNAFSEKIQSIKEPVTPSTVPSCQKIKNQLSFDLLNAPLNSPSMAILASPTGLLSSPSISRTGNMHVLGTSAFLNSPFRFSPNFNLGDLSPFFPTPNRMNFTEKSESEEMLPSTLL